MTAFAGGNQRLLVAASLLLGVATLAPSRALAHCDGLDGPVVTAARQALEKSEVNRVLIGALPVGHDRCAGPRGRDRSGRTTRGMTR